MNEKKCVSDRRVAALMFVMSLSPGLRMLPRLAVELGGRAAWVGALLAFGPLLLVWVMAKKLVNLCEPGESFSDMLIRLLGRVCGRLVVVLFLAWLIVYLGFSARVCGERYVASAYENASSFGFVAAVLALAFIGARGTLAALTRSAEVFMLVLVGVLLLVFMMTVKNVRAVNVLPVSWADSVSVVETAACALDVMSVGVYTVFLSGSMDRSPRIGRAKVVYTLILTLLVSGIIFFTLGAYGPELAARLQSPFFALIRNIRAGGTFERIEAVIIALWVVTDFSLISLVVMACCEMLKSVFRSADHRGFALPVVGAAGAAAYFVAPNAFALQWLSDRLIPMIHFGITVVGFPLLLGVLTLCKKRQKKFEKGLDRRRG